MNNYVLSFNEFSLKYKRCIEKGYNVSLSYDRKYNYYLLSYEYRNENSYFQGDYIYTWDKAVAALF